MTENEMNLMIAELAAKCDVTHEEARAALEAGNWNKLTAGHMLEDEKFRKAREVEEVVSKCEGAAAQAAATEEAGAQEETYTAEASEATAQTEKTWHNERRKHCGGKGLKNLREHFGRLVACGNRNHFVVHRNGAELVDFPVTVVAVLMLLAFWTCVPLLVIGWFLGCRYSFIGREADKAAAFIKKAVEEA